jgi:acetyltransferase-like isoleucine patch superfamily enzyme
LLIPRKSRLGFWLRRMQWLFWPMRVPRCDDSVRIHPTAIFSGFPENVELGRNVFIDAHAFIHCHKTGKIRIGDNSYVGLGAMVNTGKKGGFVTIGENCTVQAYSLVHGHGGCEIGNDVRIAGHTVIIPANHRFEDTTVTIREQGLTKSGIKIEDDVWMGAGCRILDGVTIGKGCVLGAATVVHKSLPPGSVAVGSPARVVSNRFEAQPETSQE